MSEVGECVAWLGNDARRGCQGDALCLAAMPNCDTGRVFREHLHTDGRRYVRCSGDAGCELHPGVVHVNRRPVDQVYPPGARLE